MRNGRSSERQWRFLGRASGVMLVVLVVLGAGVVALGTAVGSHVWALLWPQVSPFLDDQRATFLTLPLGQQVGQGLIGATLLMLLGLLIPLGKSAAAEIQSRQTRQDVVDAIGLDIAEIKETTADTESVVKQLQADTQKAALEAAMQLQYIERIQLILEGAATPVGDAERYGPPIDLHRLETPENYIDQEAALEAIRTTLDIGSTWRGAWIYGPSGIGKTSGLAQVVQALPRDRFPDGIVYVDCLQIHEPEAALRKVIQRFDPNRKQPPPVDLEPLLDLAQTRLSDKSALIIFDGAPVAPGYHDVAAKLTTINPDLRFIMLTNHEPSPGVSSLRPILIDYLPPAKAEDLFLKSYGWRADVEVSPEDRAHVASIVMSLGYFPLAIALYGAKARALGRSLRQFAEELRDHPLQVAGDERVRKVYQESLASLASVHPDAETLLIAWGAFGLPEIGRRALVSLASGMNIARPDSALNALHSQLLAGPIETEALPPAGDTERWRVHPLMFDYLSERFGAWPIERRQQAQTQAARHFADYVNTIPISAIAIDEIAIRKSVAWSLDANTAELEDCAVRLALPIAQFWRSRWDNERSLEYLPRLIAAASRAAMRTGLRADLLRLADLNMLYGRAIRHSGKLPLAKRYFRDDVRIRRRRKTRDRVGEAAALYQLAQIYRIRGHLPKAQRLCDKALNLARGERDKKLTGVALAELGRIARIRGQTSTAERYFQQAFNILTEAGEVLAVGVQLGYQGRIARMRGDLQLARKRFMESERLAHAAQDTRGEGVVFSYLGRIERTQGHLAEAEAYFEQSRRLAEQAGDNATLAATLGYLGRLQYTRGDLPKALEYFMRSYRLSRDTWDGQNAALVLGYIGRIHRVRGHWIRALARRIQALVMVYRIGDRRGQAKSLVQLARFALQLRLLWVADSLAARARLAFIRMEDHGGSISAQSLRGEVLASRGRLDDARATFARCKGVFERLEDSRNVCATTYWLARVAEADNQPTLARQRYAEAIELARRIGERGLEAKSYYYLGIALSRRPETLVEGKGYILRADDMYREMGSTRPSDRVRQRT